MSSIQIHDLGIVGSDLLQDCETFFDELTDEELSSLKIRGLSITVSIWGATYTFPTISTVPVTL